MKKPRVISDAMYAFMEDCWATEANDRPTFVLVVARLHSFIKSDPVLHLQLPLVGTAPFPPPHPCVFLCCVGWRIGYTPCVLLLLARVILHGFCCPFPPRLSGARCRPHRHRTLFPAKDILCASMKPGPARRGLHPPDFAPRFTGTPSSFGGTMPPALPF